uniref:Large ribosomal subunit protein bL9m n=1 Tax=Timema douglasi TaxID=61478 RepID=A0A7R8VV58_TIMDO|nr:unnamed protein product [Timema douglasi]
MEIILTDYVSGLGARGDKVSVKPNFAYNNLLLPGLAVYSTPENSEKYCTPQEESIKPKFSSPYASRTVGFLSKKTVAIVMNKEIPWKLEPWHIRMSFRKAGVDVAEHAIELPEKPITGPNLDLECKIFFVTITVNGTEKVSVKCQIHHWSTKISDRLPWVEEFWKQDKEYVFSEETKTLEHINDNAGSSPP